MTKIKFCGLKRPCDIALANELRPDYIGFIFAPKSRRYVSFTDASKLKSALSTDISAVGVFTNEPQENILKLLRDGVIDAVQLHGCESEEYVAALKEQTSKPVIKAFRIESSDDVRRAALSCADFILLDSGSGGTGSVFDWKLIRGIKRPYFLAGGLSSDNAAEALKSLSPYALDVSSGIETDGFKDPLKMRNFMRVIRDLKKD